MGRDLKHEIFRKTIGIAFDRAIYRLGLQPIHARMARLASETAIRFGAVLDSIDAHRFVRVINPVKNAPIARS
jgi:hypothetical protein